MVDGKSLLYPPGWWFQSILLALLNTYVLLYTIDFLIIRYNHPIKYNHPIIVGMYLTSNMIENPNSWCKARCHDVMTSCGNYMAFFKLQSTDWLSNHDENGMPENGVSKNAPWMKPNVVKPHFEVPYFVTNNSGNHRVWSHPWTGANSIGQASREALEALDHPLWRISCLRVDTFVNIKFREKKKNNITQLLSR